MENDNGRLVITRRVGEAFWIGDDLRIEVLNIDAEAVMLEVNHGGMMVVGMMGRWLVSELATVIPVKNTCATQVKIAIEAPRCIKIAREELLGVGELEYREEVIASL